MVGRYVIHSIGFYTICFVTIFAILSFDRHFYFLFFSLCISIPNYFPNNLPALSVRLSMVSSQWKNTLSGIVSKINREKKNSNHTLTSVTVEKCSTESTLCILCVYDLLNVYACAYVIRYLYVWTFWCWFSLSFSFSFRKRCA